LGLYDTMRIIANYYNAKGQKRDDAGDAAGAIRFYEKAIASEPGWSTPWYNLGLVYKYLGDWRESYRCNAEAMRLSPDSEAAIWNTGIAATALGDWKEARRAWTTYGIAVPAGDGPIQMDLGCVPIRINPNGDGEVIWCNRIDPARAVITSVPLPESNHRCGDLLLHDGAPVGYRMSGGREVPVFNELAVLTPSSLYTFAVDVDVQTIDDLVELERECEAAGCTAEDWSTVRMICRACSEGRPHDHGHEAPEPAIEGTHNFAVAAPAIEVARNAVSAWLAKRPHCSASEVELVSASK
jgi:hypothetical protein